MRRRAASLLIVAALVTGGCADSAAGPSAGVSTGPNRAPAASSQSASAQDRGRAAYRPLGGITRWRAVAHVRHLARRIGVRVRATDAERAGQRYAKRELRALGYRVYVQRFPVDAGTSRNVVARWPGARRYPVVIGAHMDSVPGSPGANDNASGVAVLLEVARLFAGRRAAQWVKFVTFGSEEFGPDNQHHIGSQVFVNRLGGKGRRKLAGMVSVDMVADGRPLLVGTAGIGPARVAHSVLKRIQGAGIGAVYRTTCDCSDNGPFERAGIPASFLHSGPEPDYHAPSDVVRNLSKRDLVRTGRALRAYVRSLNRRLIRYYRGV